VVVWLSGILDLAFGEPPTRLHPVGWLGKWLDRCERVCYRDSRRSGALALALALAPVLAAAGLAESLALALEDPWRVMVLAVLLKPSFALRGLFQAVAAVERAFDGGLDAARARLSEIVSRDTRRLDAGGVRMAAISSLAENLSDSVLAPLFYYALFGLPGAWVYRAVNTADAMWGYTDLGGVEGAGDPRGRRYRHFGWAAARLDDLLNLVPSRLAAILILPRVWALAGEARKTRSPNAGWPMAAMALALGVRLEKRGHYVLNPGGRVPGGRDVTRALIRAGTAASGAGFLLGLLAGLGGGR